VNNIGTAVGIALDRPFDEVVVVLILFTSPVILGLALIALARWARRRNAVLRLGTVRDAELFAAISRRQWRELGRLFFLSDAPRVWELAGRMLALLAIVAVLSLLVFILVVLLRATANA
jgi:hypothetical protein